MSLFTINQILWITATPSMERSLPTNGKIAQKLLISFLCSNTIHPILKNHVPVCRIKVWEERDTDHLWIQTAQQKLSRKTDGAGQLKAAFHTTWPFCKVHPLRHTTIVLWHRILKTSKPQQGPLVYLNLIILQLSTGQFLYQMHRVHTKYSKGIGSSAS